MSLFQPEPSIIGYIHKCPLSLICSVEAVGSVTAVTTAEGTSGFFLFPDMKCHTYANVSAMPGTDIFNHNDNVFLSHKKFSSCWFLHFKPGETQMNWLWCCTTFEGDCTYVKSNLQTRLLLIAHDFIMGLWAKLSISLTLVQSCLVPLIKELCIKTLNQWKYRHAEHSTWLNHRRCFIYLPTIGTHFSETRFQSELQTFVSVILKSSHDSCLL